MFPFSKDTQYNITQYYWLVNLNIHLEGEPKKKSKTTKKAHAIHLLYRSKYFLYISCIELIIICNGIYVIPLLLLTGKQNKRVTFNLILIYFSAILTW